METYLHTSHASVGGCGPDDTVVVKVEAFDMLKCCDERHLSGAGMLKREMGMGRGLLEKEKSLDGDGRGQFGPELRLYIHSRDILFYVIGSTPYCMAARSMIQLHKQVDRMTYVD